MVRGKTFWIANKWGFLAHCANAPNNRALNNSRATMTPRLKEKMMISREPMTDTIIKVNKDMGSSMIMARLRIFRYTPYLFILDHYSDEIGEDAHHGPGDQHKDQYPGNALFQVGVLPKKMTGIEQKAHQEDNAQNDGKDGPYGIGNIIDRILDAPDLGQDGTGNKK